MYYLNSRYYNPEIGRFINSDSIIGANQDLLSNNLYAYVSNNPINKLDKNGENAIGALGVIGIGGLAAGTIGSFGLLGLGTIVVVALVDYGSKGKTIATTQTNTKTTTPKKDTNVHHIVAQSSPKAAPARDVLAMVNIKVNNPVNLVVLPTSYHQSLHTNNYYSNINMRMLMAYNAPGDKRRNVENALNLTRTELIFKIFPK